MLEISDEFTSSDMTHMVGATPSRSLEDDLKESVYAIYHKEVSKVILEERKKLLDTAQSICDEANKLITSKPHTKKEIREIQERAQWTFDEEKKMYRQRIDDAIKKKREKLALLLTNIEAYARTRV